jgi:NAD(P)-dependent dehydrogenase (short-subunit alcohol dehydrogenase family)
MDADLGDADVLAAGATDGTGRATAVRRARRGATVPVPGCTNRHRVRPGDS